MRDQAGHTLAVSEPPPDAPASGWQRRRQRIAMELERVALELFATAGVEDVTTEQIAAAAGVSLRTLYRYFPTRDEILAALPKRELDEQSMRFRARPRHETLIEALAASNPPHVDPERRYLELLWGRVVQLSPGAAAMAMAQSAVDIGETYGRLVAERLELAPDDPKAGAMGAAIAGVVGFTYQGWVTSRGQDPLGDLLAQNLQVLCHFDDPPPALAAEAIARSTGSDGHDMSIFPAAVAIDDRHSPFSETN
jgi:AcrR family transcriptional regulator